MENNLTNKTKYFAQYYGQECLTVGNANTDNVSEHWGEDLIFKGQYLLLTPLSQITDEDAIEVAKIFNQHKIKAHYNEADLRDYLIKEGKQYASRCELYVVIYQYLQSKCYALPFMGLSVEQLIEYGWLRLKN